MGFMKRFFGHQVKKEESPSSTPVTSNHATPIVSPAISPAISPAVSMYDVDVKQQQDKYHNDPMRTNKKPDTIGSFLDPMGGHGSYSVGRDVTNTGA